MPDDAERGRGDRHAPGELTVTAGNGQRRAVSAPAAPVHLPGPGRTPSTNDLAHRYRLVEWMERRLLEAHQAAEARGDPAHTRRVAHACLSSFIDVVEDLMLHCDEVAAGLAAGSAGRGDGDAGTSTGAACAVWVALERTLVFYTKEQRFLQALERAEEASTTLSRGGCT